MADSLFDNRYRYDYIYPRGRSGETLRAVDTQDGDRPVVIKRPAPNDAPPIRAGQEVSILNERKALTRLAGHPALCALTGTGQFLVGGVAHQYIVIERADGVIIGDLVLELAAQNERLPELEMLVIVDALLDLLIAAHQQDIVYNDVDAKHLFWNRELYRLKVIDWGNAVFLEGDEQTPQGISRASDIYQVGELLYFIVTGGGRVEVTRDPARAGEDFQLDFGPDGARLHSRLAAIISRAAHPNPRLRYRSLDELRRDLAEYAEPIRRDRDAIVARVSERLKRDLSKDDLVAALKQLEPALNADPGYPGARAVQREIYSRLSDLEVAADLDAARIYLDTSNWARAIAVLDELRQRARGDLSVQIGLLADWARLLQDSGIQRPPPAVRTALAAIFDNDPVRAAGILQTQDIDDPDFRSIQWLLAERISSHVPDILLLLPNLYRLELALATLEAEGAAVSEPRALLHEIMQAIDHLAHPASISLVVLRDGFRGVVDRLTALNSMLEACQVRLGLPPRKLPMNAVTRALNAAMAITDNIHIIGRTATDRRNAGAALETVREIAPGMPVWDSIQALLDELYSRIDAFERYVPAPDGSDVADWLTTSAQELIPYTERLFDETLVSMVFGLNAASRSWAAYAEAVVLGARGAALQALQATMDAVSGVSPNLVGWLGQLRSVVSAADHVERHALHGALGRALAEGWQHFDRGRLVEAERLAIQANEAAQTEIERYAARRLRELSLHAREWAERGGPLDPERTATVANLVEALFTRDEIAARDGFAAQMPGRETYLKAMSKSLVENLSRLSTAAPRLLFTQFVLQAAAAAQVDDEDDYLFWRECAVRALGEVGARHLLLRALTDALDRRRDMREAARLLDSINGPEALAQIPAALQALEDSPALRSFGQASFSLRELEAAVRDWADGDFRAAGLRLENIIKTLEEAMTKQPEFQPMRFLAYLRELIAGAAELHQRGRKLSEIIASQPDGVPPLARSIHHEWVDGTARLIGPDNTGAPQRWRDVFETFASLFTDRSLRRSAKLPRFAELLALEGVDRHPAYPLYQHWQRLVEQSSEFPAPVTEDPVPRLAEDDLAAIDLTAGPFDGDGAILPDPVAAPTDEPRPRRGRQRGRQFNPLMLVLLLGGALLLALVVASSISRPDGGADPEQNRLAAAPDETATRSAAQTALAEIGVTLTLLPQMLAASDSSPAAPETEEAAPETPDSAASAGDPGASPTPLVVLATVAPRQSETPLPTRTPTLTLTPTLTPTASPTFTATASHTPPPTATPTPTLTPSPAPTATPTLPPQGLQGEYSLLRWADSDPSWIALYPLGAFIPGTEGDFWRLGTGAPIGAENGQIAVGPSANAFNQRYGNNAPARLLRAAARLSLVTFNPPLLIDDEVYFGFALVNPDDGQRTGVEIHVVQAGLINVMLVNGSERTVISQRSDTASDVRLRLERDPVNNQLVVYYGNDALGQRLPLRADQPLIPTLYVHDGGVIVHVLDWTVTLR
jgi:hypothetical protein